MDAPALNGEHAVMARRYIYQRLSEILNPVMDEDTCDSRSCGNPLGEPGDGAVIILVTA